ncbi:ABC-three component system middle component 1 [Metasolibacillus meyeri]|uniref:ABC-three component system middle component 1 n=1 Tax=Metasolibacillus meyeri TaxID=1071052 RepID=UPI000D306B54|nr:ABC-three component system middle component 1 [Metasolibacillus meyeri]
MVDEVIKYFREKDKFIEFQNMQLNLLKFVFGNPQQIFGIVVFEGENWLKRDWRKACEEFAVRIQSELVASLYNLKWDMYLILISQTDIEDIELCKHIENDRMYFKKIVLARNLEKFQRKLPIELELDDSNQLEVFSDKQFLDELRKVVSSEVEKRLDFDIYEGKSIDEVNKMIFLEPYNIKGV